MSEIIVTTEMAQGAHRWVVYVTVNSETVTHYFDTQEEAVEFAASLQGESS